MVIYLDFDGTVVEHAYPQIGRCNFGCVEVIEKLQKSGHEIILNTLRSELNETDLQQSLRWFDGAWMFVRNKEIQYDFNLEPIKTTKHKIHPYPWVVENDVVIPHIFNGVETIFIDDIATNIPLKPSVMVLGDMVNWDVLDHQFKVSKFY